MKTFNNKKRATTLITVATLAFIFLFTACNQAGGGGNTDGGGEGGKPTPTPTPKPKHAITFNVDGANGKIKAKADGVDETSTSPINVEEGKTVTFTATANAGYKVKGWTLDGKPVAEADTNTEYKLTVSKAVIVKVSFEEIPPSKHAVSFSVIDGKGGTLKAKSEGIYETEESPITVDEGKEVTFTAEPSTNYKVKEWKLGDEVITEAGTNTEYTHKVKGACAITVSFEKIPHGKAILTLDLSKPAIKVKATTSDGSAIEVGGCNETSLESGVQTELHATGATVTLTGYITELDFSGSYKKEQSVIALDVHGLTTLRKLSCNYNYLTVLDLHGLTSLQELYCAGNQLTELNVQGLTALRYLYCSRNQLPELNLQGLTSLQELDCYKNQLSTLDVHGLTSLQKLWCQINQLTTLNVQGCTALKDLICTSNRLNAKAMIDLLNALPARDAYDSARAVLYTEKEAEGNWTNFTKPYGIEAALKGAKERNWRVVKVSSKGRYVSV